MADNNLAISRHNRLVLIPSMISIAAKAATIMLLITTSVQGLAETNTAGRAQLPQLGNTDHNDRILLQEITDEHTVEAQPQLLATAQTTDDTELPIGTSTITSVPAPVSAWDSIRAADRLPRERNQRVEFYIDQYQREVLWINKILNRGTPFIGYIVQSLESRFLPVELALIPAIESGFRTTVKSSVNAAGIWQIVPITAREIGVERNTWFDGRGDIVKSTTAAIDYLSYLNAEFNGDWELTLAAYNAGPGRVRGAIKKNIKAEKPTDFWSLDLPTETLNYVPKIVAMLELIKDPETRGLDLPDMPVTADFTIVDVGKRISLDHAATMSNVDEALLGQLNAGLIHQVTPPKGPHLIVVPASAVQRFKRAIAAAGNTKLFSLPLTHTVVAGDSVSTIAFKYGITQRKLREINSLDNSRILIGQSLGVIDVRGTNTSARSTMVEYVVKIGDTLSEIAERFAVKISAIQNSTGKTPDNNVIHPGEKLIIQVLSGDG
ncbi:MAG: transglycosylase SLT domain-containing protein [Granulosicoccaceae bacterium]